MHVGNLEKNLQFDKLRMHTCSSTTKTCMFGVTNLNFEFGD